MDAMLRGSEAASDQMQRKQRPAVRNQERT